MQNSGNIYRWHYVLILIIGFSVFALGRLGVHVFLAPDPISCPAVNEPDIVKEAAGRVKFFSAFLVYLCFAVGMIGFFAYEIINLFSKMERRRLIMFGVVILTVGISVYAIRDGCIICHHKILIGACLFESFEKLESIGILGHPLWSREVHDGLLQTYAVVTVASLLSITVALVSCLEDVPAREHAEAWKFQSARFQRVVYLSSTLLAVGTLANGAWLSYPEFMICENAPLKRFNELVAALTAYVGVYYSLTVAAIAIPVAMLLSRKADNYVLLTCGQVKNSQKLSKLEMAVYIANKRNEYGLRLQPTEVLKTIIALLGPILAGTFGKLLEAV